MMRFPLPPSLIVLYAATENTYGDLETLVSEDERSVSGGKIAIHCRKLKIGTERLEELVLDACTAL